MANMELIEAKTSTSSSVTFSSIPATYTDLKLVTSCRGTSNGSGTSWYTLSLNGVTTNINGRFVQGENGSAGSSTFTNLLGQNNPSTYTADTFSSNEHYFPNYTSTSNYKSISNDYVMENNSTNSNLGLSATLWSDTPVAITSITLTTQTGNFATGSTFYLYGISNVTSGSKATGGIVSSDGTYWYHMFPFSGTFTPTTAISADVLCIAGGGSGGSGGGAGGGAGGLVYLTSQSLTATGYTVSVGAGGANQTGSNLQGNDGSNSQFGALTAAVGGGGGGCYNGASGRNGGSGGGGGGRDFSTSGGAAGTGTAGQGNNGGSTTQTSDYYGGGGGGAGGTGGTTVNTVSAGNGGVGVNTYLSWASATQTGVNGYYAGGGGGSCNTAGTAGIGGLGGGGNGSVVAAGVTRGVANTGGGGGGANNGNALAGGSGLVIIRYAI